MNCTSCGHGNGAGAKFCEECGTPLERACANCGTSLRATVKFCPECGTAVAGGAAAGPPATTAAHPSPPATSAPAAGVRKIVTIVFADLAGSTALQERLDPESTSRFMESYYDAMRAAVEAHGGTVTQFLGDGVKAVFGIPRVAEDDAIRAVRAAVAMQEGFRALAERQRGAVGKTGLRVAVNTGEVIANDDAEIIGDPVNVAARLQEQGGDGDVVIGDSTARLVEALVTLAPLGSFALKGRAEAVAAFTVASLEPPAGATAAAFVGREEEIGGLRSVYDGAVGKPATALAVLLGSPGLGKSRLIDEFVRQLGDAVDVVSAHCNEASDSSFAPLAVAIRERFDIDADASEETLRGAIEGALRPDNAERTRIARGIAALLAGSPTSAEETFFVLRRLFAALASDRPVVLVMDDLQWGEPLLLDLVEHLVEWGSGVPLLVLVGARPELRDKRSSLTRSGGLVSEALTLSGLDAGAAMRLAANVIGAADLPAVVAAKVLATSEGNPLFVGELVRMLVHEGALTREGDRWTTGKALAALEMPPTIHALLAARIERLHPEERLVLERAAVVGRHFSRSAVAELLPHDVADLDARLEALGRGELIERDSGWFLGEPVLRFHHVLIRDAAYRQLLKGTRAELHTRFADWVVGRTGDSVEHDETIGWHLEQAHQHLGELGPIDAAGRAIGERAATHLAAAGRRALARDDVPLAASLLGRAIRRLDDGDPARAELALDWCEALLAAGDIGAAEGAIDELGRFTGDDVRLRAWHTCFAGQHTVLTAPEGLERTADTVAAAADSLAGLGDDAGEATAHYVYALALQRLGKVGACEAALDRALAAARRVAGDRRRANTVLAIAPLAALWGPGPVTRASGRCLDVVRVLRITQGAPAVEAVALSCQGVLEALRGRTDAARRMIASARKMVEELGITQRVLEVDLFDGLVDLLENDAVAAERNLRTAYEGMRELGLGIAAARAAAQLARALLAQDRVEEAEALSHQSEALAGDDLKAAIAWRGVRAEALARRGEHAAAVEFASKAVEMAAATDALLDHADARVALATALAAAGRGREAEAVRARASELWEAKGATLLAERAVDEDEQVADADVSAPEHAATRPPARRRVRPNRATQAEQFQAAARPRDFEAARESFSDDHVMSERPTGARREAEALTRFDALTQGAQSRARFENTATRQMGRFFAAWDARDWEAVDALFGPDMRQIDRRDLMHLELDRSQHLESLRFSFDRASSHFESEVLATRGERLDLERLCLQITDDATGPSEIEFLALNETDANGDVVTLVRWNSDDLDAAFAELDARYGAGEAAAHPRARASSSLDDLRAHDWDAYTARFSPDLVLYDHRLLGWETLHGAEAFVRTQQALVELAPDAQWRVDHVALAEHGLLVSAVTFGTREGGPFELAYVRVNEIDAAGKVCRTDLYDEDQADAALARFAEIEAIGVESPAIEAPGVESTDASNPPSLLLRPNAATATIELWIRAFDVAFETDDWDPVRQLSAPDCVLEDRRSMSLLSGDGELMIASARERARAGARPQIDPVGTAGDRVVLSRVLWAGGPPDGRFEIEYLGVFEVDASGLLRAFILLDPDDPRAAQREAWARWAAVEPWAERVTDAIGAQIDAFNAHDPVRYRTVFADDLVVEDHRHAGMGSIEGADAYIASLVTLWELAPVSQVEAGWHWPAVDAHAALTDVRRTGTVPDGGDFESDYLGLYVLEGDKVSRLELFELEALDDALARFDALRARGAGAKRLEPFFANAATRTIERAAEAFEARDWKRFGALFAAEFRNFDRVYQLESNREQWLAAFREIVEMTTSRPPHTVLATRGERLALIRMTWQGAQGDVGPSEIDWLLVIEVDERGDHLAVVTLDPTALDAAYAELDARWVAGAPAGHASASAWLGAFQLGFADRDWDAIGALSAPEQVAVNHRSVGWGTLRGPGAWVPTLQALVELAADTALRVDHVRSSERGILWQSAWCGTRDGGPFETPQLVVVELDAQGRQSRMDVWDDDKLPEARERFESLAPGAAADRGPHAAKPNLASAAMDRWPAVFDACVASDDWQPMREMFAPDARYEDRQRRSLISGDREMQVASVRERSALGARPEHRVLATVGDRIVLQRMLWAGGPQGGRFEVEHLSLAEVDASGHFVANTLFDMDDLRAAEREAWSRWAAIDPIAAPIVDLLGTLARAWNARDAAGIRARFADDVVVYDHRLAGLGRIEGADAYVESNVVLWGLAPDQRIAFECSLPAYGPDSTVAVIRREGTVPDGGAFESVYLWLSRMRDGLVTHLELFEVDAFETALARFEALRPDPLRVPPNAATRVIERVHELRAGRNLDGLAALAADDFCFEDRKRQSLVTGGFDAWRRALEFLWTETGARVETRPVATAGDRLALDRVLWRETPGDGPFEIEGLRLTEVDADGKVRALLLFDANDERVAVAELFERYVASGADGMPRGALDFIRGVNEGDPVRLRQSLCDDFVLDDHRRTGMGRLDGADRYIESIAVMDELALELRVDSLYVARASSRGRVFVSRTRGKNAEGGAFESVFAVLMLYRAEKIGRMEFFEIERLDTAIARFEQATTEGNT